MPEIKPYPYKNLSKQKAINEIETKYQLELRELTGLYNALSNRVKVVEDWMNHEKYKNDHP